MRRFSIGAFATVCAATAMLLAGCAGASSAGAVPESARLAPADALAFATVTTDEGSAQWQQAEALLERVPGARDGFASEVSQAVAEEGLTWEEDVAPALGPEVVLVVTAGRKPVVLTQPDDEAKLDSLIATSSEPIVRRSFGDWIALAETEADLDAYGAAVQRGTLEDADAFVEGMEALPGDALGRAWVDVARAAEDLGELFEQASSEVDLGLDWVAVALSAQEDGLLLTLGARTPGGADTHYEPELFDRVPADAVAAFSFGGTQGILDRVESSVDVDEISTRLEDLTGISLDGVVDALSGEGVLYLRAGEETPEVTLVLTPPNPDQTWETLGRLARTVSEQTGTPIETVTENGVEVRRTRRRFRSRGWTRTRSSSRRASTRSVVSSGTATSSSTRTPSGGRRMRSSSATGRAASSMSTSTAWSRSWRGSQGRAACRRAPGSPSSRSTL
jgi:hypothetical protein